MTHSQSLTYTTVLGVFFGALMLLIPFFAGAQQLPSSNPTVLPGNNPTAHSGSGQSFSVQNPLKNITSFSGLVKALLDAAIIIGIPVAVLFIVFAGLRFVTALGNPTKLETAKRNLLYTVIGIAIFLGSWIIAQVIFNTVTKLGGGA